MLYLFVISIFETWSEEEKAFFAGRKLTLNDNEIKRISDLRHHPTRRSGFLQYLKVRENSIKRENKWLSTIGEI